MIIKLILAANSNDALKNDPFMPLSLPLIASSAPEHKYIFVDMLSENNVNFDEKIDIAGISYRITAEKTAFKIADEFRKRGVKVVFGGPQASNTPFEAKKHCDSVAVGEAEPLWPVILNDFSSGKMKDFYVASPVKFNAEGFAVYQINDFFDLNKANVMPVRNKFKKKYRFDTVYASRGCPIDCDFCSVSKMFGSKTRLRKTDDVVKEINTFKNYYYLLDDNVFGRSFNYDYYLELYKKISGLKKKRLWVGQANLDAAASEKGREVIKAAAESGLVYASIGIESINYEVLKKSGSLNKIGTSDSEKLLAVMKENIKFIQEQGIIISGWFTIGYEEDSIKTYYDTVDFCIDAKILPIISPLEAIPGTRLFDMLEKKKMIDFTKKINIRHPVMSDEDIINALKEINKKGFSFKENLSRIMHHFKLFDRNNKNINSRITNIIHKTFFLAILQGKIKKGVSSFANNESFIEK